MEKGADVDAKGGELQATPLCWASRNGYNSIVHLLLTYSADPTIPDSQSFNSLHLAVHSSSALLVAYYLFTSQPLAVDTSDIHGHTSLGWAAYQGDALSVELLIKAGADPNKRDNEGLTCLHWAVVKGNSSCIKLILEAGGDINRKDNSGKTPKDLAIELKSEAAWKRALRAAGMEEDGRKRTGVLTEKNTKLAILMLPTFFFMLIFWTISILPWYTGLLIGAGEFYAMHHIVTRVLLDIKAGEGNKMVKSPYLYSVILGSIFWVGYVWVTRLVNNTPGSAIANLVFFVS